MALMMGATVFRLTGITLSLTVRDTQLTVPVKIPECLMFKRMESSLKISYLPEAVPIAAVQSVQARI